MKIAICHITGNGGRIAEELTGNFPRSQVFDLSGKGNVSQWVNENFHAFEGHIFIMSMGIVYRVIADLISDKYHDPAVVVVDDARRFSIAALSGHEGGANDLAFKTAQILDNQPVITTASDTNKSITLGIGCRKGTTEEQILSAVNQALQANDLTSDNIRIAASVDIKKTEQGMLMAFDQLNIPLLFISSERIRNFTGYTNESKAAMRQLGLPGVSEPCALLSARKGELIMEKTVYGNVTIALAMEEMK